MHIKQVNKNIKDNNILLNGGWREKSQYHYNTWFQKELLFQRENETNAKPTIKMEYINSKWQVK